MEELNFFDSNVMLGEQASMMKGRIHETSEIIDRLCECGIKEALAYHSCSVYNNPLLGNRLILKEIEGYETIYPVWALLPFTTLELGHRQELKNDLIRSRIKGVLLCPGSHGFVLSDWCCGDLLEMLETLNIPVFVSMNDASWNELQKILSYYPHLNIVLRGAHYGTSRALYRLLEKYKNLYVETWSYQVFFGIEEIVRHFGADRLIFGSNFPVYSPGASTLPILLSEISLEDKRKIAGGNLRKLLGGINDDI